MALALWACVSGLAAAPGAADPPPAGPAVRGPLLRSADLRADAALLEQAWRDLHPGLFRYLTPESFARERAVLEGDLGRDQALGEAFLAFSRFAATVRCGHTWASFFNQSKAVREALFDGTRRLPFHFRWLEGRMVVTRDLTAAGLLPRGTEVVRIDGRPVAEVLARLLPLARADGGNDAKRVAQLGVDGESTYEAFDVYYPLLFGLGPRAVLEVRRFGEGPSRTEAVATLAHSERAAPLAARQAALKGGDAPVFEWRDETDGTAVLRMPTWALYDSRWDWRRWLDERLDALVDRAAPALVVDLRGNEGGNDVGDVLVARLVDEALPVAALRRLVRYRKVPDALAPHLDTWDPGFKDWGREATELAAPWPTAPAVPYLSLAGEGGEAEARTVIRPAAKRFRGRVFVLVDATNSSATFQFAQLVQSRRLATLVGQPTGGNRRGINGGAFFFLRLPRSGLELDLPLVGQFPRAPEPDGGLVPDVVTRPTIEDVAAGRDVEREAVARLLGARAGSRGRRGPARAGGDRER